MIPTPPDGAVVYQHPQGKVIHVHPDGTMDTYKPDGKRSSSSATPEKLAAGYGGWSRVSGDDAPGPIPEMTEAVSPVTTNGPRIPMTYHEAVMENIRSLIEDEKSVVEQKLDGARVLVVVKNGKVRFLGRNGQPLKHAASAQYFNNLRTTLEDRFDQQDDEVVLDGEIMGDTGELWLFDCPHVILSGTVASTPTTPFNERRAVVDVIASQLNARNSKIRLTPQAVTLEEKLALVKSIEDAGGEGVMVKHVDSTYDGGSRVKHSVKVKFVKTADVVVLERDVKGTKNAVLGVYENGELREIGKCSMIGKPDAQIGDVIEVAFLYWTGTKIYQPRMIKMRDDKQPQDTSMDQFPIYSKKVIVP